MALLGMIVSGCGFLCVGTWQAWSTLVTHSGSGRFSGRSLTKASPFPVTQLVFIAGMAFVHIISGVVASRRDASLADGIGMAVPLERSAVAFTFFIFAITSLITDRTNLLPLPWEFLDMLALFAFGKEFLLFYLQRPDSGLESRYYDLLLVPITACIAASAARISYHSSTLPSLVRAGALVLQGSWMVQMGVSLFSSTFMAKGCILKERGTGDYVIYCEGMALMRGKAIATLQFNCQMALVLIIMLLLYGFLTRKEDIALNGMNYEMVDSADLYERKSAGSLIGQAPQSTFTISMDDDEVASAADQYDVTHLPSVTA